MVYLDDRIETVMLTTKNHPFKHEEIDCSCYTIPTSCDFTRTKLIYVTFLVIAMTEVFYNKPKWFIS